MRTLRILLVLAVSGAFLQASDLSKLKHSCGSLVTEQGLGFGGETVVTYSPPAETHTTISFDGDGKYQDASDAIAGAQVQKACEAAAMLRAKKDVAPHFDAQPAPAVVSTVTPAVIQSSPNSGGMTLAVLLLVLGGAIYFFPMAVGFHRNCKASAGIAVINIFLGWTFVGWVVALAWAASGETHPKPQKTATVSQ